MPTSAPRTRAQTYAAARAFIGRSFAYGMCLQWSRQMAGIPARYRSATEASKHVTLHDGEPPKGTFVYWTRGSRGFGHIAISAGDWNVITTDYPRSRRVGRGRISTLTDRWNLRYRGWSDECNEMVLRQDRPSPRPTPRPTPSPRRYPRPKSRVVYDSKVKPGQQNSDSVWWIQFAINRLQTKGRLKNAKRLALTGDYGRETVAMAKLVQTQLFKDRPDGAFGPKQTRRLFKMAGIKVTHKEKP